MKLYTEEDFVEMRKVGQLAAKQLRELEPLMVPGIKTRDIDDFCRKMTLAAGGYCAPYGYLGKGHTPFPKSICTSVNAVICHGIPTKYKLVNGDIINVDVTPVLNKFHGDTSRTYKIGKVSEVAERLIQVTYDCLMFAIEEVKPGAPIRNIGIQIQEYAEKNGFSVVREMCGHGTGLVFHDEPQILHFNEVGNPYQDTKMEPGMIFTIEPMINEGAREMEFLDNWVVATKDRKLSAQFEHTIGVSSYNYEIFTL